jgi:hypothetical protein
LSRDRDSFSRRKSTDFSRGSIIDGLPLGRILGDNRTLTGDTESAAEKDLKKELDNQYSTCTKPFIYVIK